ncbi:nuclear receptor 2C2-associated protein [Stomoxys calcitrans]|uniref:nuclear receptor 2C2-associated protein n=1 Tax=Stomoxys calcitrans TaxID=35570 RepID=UPI0027E396E6|nr:nuclear receptor 2C2-associated protein [Stomoxys calcitrans]XP_059226121.1 nuclear receptor 2C2-associated protein [Stomoxys calcitrans]
MDKQSILSSENFKCSVSSVLNKDTKQHGKQFLYDGQDDTAWSSNEGSPQYISIEFENLQSISSFSLQFQGGFASKEGRIEIQREKDETGGSTAYDQTFYADDVNSVQCFKLEEPQTRVRRVKFVFNTSTDFFGRIIVYSLKIFK